MPSILASCASTSAKHRARSKRTPKAARPSSYRRWCECRRHGRAIQNVQGYGRVLNRKLREWSVGDAGMNMQGTTLISANRFVDLDPDREGDFGMPLRRVHRHYDASYVAMARDMVGEWKEIIRAGAV